MVTILGEIEGNKIYYDYDARKYTVKDMDIHGCTHTFENDSLEDLVIHINKTIKCHKRKMRNKSVVFIGLMALISFVVGIIIFELVKDYTNALAIILSLFIRLTVTALVIIFDSKKKVEFKITTQAGLYVKEFISGDEGRTEPSISGLLNNKVKKIELDVIKIHCD